MGGGKLVGAGQAGADGGSRAGMWGAGAWLCAKSVELGKCSGSAVAVFWFSDEQYRRVHASWMTK
jgi:hypothetical protein